MVRIGVIGANHNHIYGMTDQLLDAGAELVSFYVPEPDLAAQFATRHGKDFFSDKPAFTDLAVLEEARQVQRETGRMYAISYSERLQSRAMVKAGELVFTQGAIGTPLQTVGLGPHRLNRKSRPRW